MWSAKVNGTSQRGSVDADSQELLRVKGELDATKFELKIRDEELTTLNQKHADEIREFNHTYDNLRGHIAALEEDLALAERSGTRDFRISRDLKAQVDSHVARIKHLEGQLATVCMQAEQTEAARKESQAAYEANLLMTTRLKNDLDLERASSSEKSRHLDRERALNNEKSRRLDMRGRTIQQLEQRISDWRNNQGKKDLGELNTQKDPKRLRHW